MTDSKERHIFWLLPMLSIAWSLTSIVSFLQPPYLSRVLHLVTLENKDLSSLTSIIMSLVTLLSRSQTNGKPQVFGWDTQRPCQRLDVISDSSERQKIIQSHALLHGSRFHSVKASMVETVFNWHFGMVFSWKNLLMRKVFTRQHHLSPKTRVTGLAITFKSTSKEILTSLPCSWPMIFPSLLQDLSGLIPYHSKIALTQLVRKFHSEISLKISIEYSNIH